MIVDSGTKLVWVREISFDGTQQRVLHLVDQDEPALCGLAAARYTTTRIQKYDLLCGRCLDTWNSLHGDEIVPADDTGYRAYLTTDLWQRTRALALEFYGERCCLCNTPDELNVHHRTYERVGKERLSDLIVLCRDCHARFHGKAA